MVKARVIQKSVMRQYEKNNRIGKVFNFTLQDSSGEIRCSAFDKFADKFYDLLQVNQ